MEYYIICEWCMERQRETWKMKNRFEAHETDLDQIIQRFVSYY